MHIMRVGAHVAWQLAKDDARIGRKVWQVASTLVMALWVLWCAGWYMMPGANRTQAMHRQQVLRAGWRGLQQRVAQVRA
jgi:hypothetical protein